jgi:adenylosuccinate lyase
VTAEPLYVLLALAGHPDAHEQARILARKARVEKVKLSDVIRSEPGLALYLQSMTPDQRAVLDDPAKYLGASALRTRAICDHWEKRLAELAASI